MTDKMATAISVHSCGHSNSVIFNRISSKFHIWIAPIKLSFMIEYEYEFCPTKDNQDGRQNGRRLSVYTYGQSTLVIYYPIASKFHIWITFIKLLPKFEYGLCPITKTASKMATTCYLPYIKSPSERGKFLLIIMC